MRGSPRGGCGGSAGGSGGERDGRAGRVGLRRHHRRAAGRGAGGAAARVPAVGALLGRGHARARRRRPAHVRARTSAATRRAPVPTGPRRLPDGRGGRRRGGRRRGGARGDRAVARARRRARLGRDRRLDARRGRRPELVQTVTGISAPPPGRHGRRAAPAPPVRRVVVHGGVRRARAGRAGVRRPARSSRGRRRWCACSSSPARPGERAERDAARPRRPGRAHRGAELVPGDPAAAAARPAAATTAPRCSSGATATPP